MTFYDSYVRELPNPGNQDELDEAEALCRGKVTVVQKPPVVDHPPPPTPIVKPPPPEHAVREVPPPPPEPPPPEPAPSQDHKRIAGLIVGGSASCSKAARSTSRSTASIRATR